MSIGLVLEGGGMRGAFTSGVLEVFLREGIDFKYVIGVSAGALTAMSYLSKQKRRNYNTFVEYATNDQYASVANLAKTGNIFNFDYILGEVVDELLPFDFDTFFANDAEFVIGTTHCESGRPVFFRKSQLQKQPDYKQALLTALRASSSLPLVSKNVEIGGYDFLDGGIASPVPFEKSMADGNERNVVVLTRNADYQMKPYSSAMRAMLKSMYTQYPNLVRTVCMRHEIYRRQLVRLEELEQEGKVIIIRPIAPLKVDRYEKNREKLAELHDTAMIECYNKIPQIKQWFKEEN